MSYTVREIPSAPTVAPGEMGNAGRGMDCWQ